MPPAPCPRVPWIRVDRAYRLGEAVDSPHRTPRPRRYRSLLMALQEILPRLGLFYPRSRRKTLRGRRTFQAGRGAGILPASCQPGTLDLRGTLAAAKRSPLRTHPPAADKTVNSFGRIASRVHHDLYRN